MIPGEVSSTLSASYSPLAPWPSPATAPP